MLQLYIHEQQCYFKGHKTFIWKGATFIQNLQSDTLNKNPSELCFYLSYRFGDVVVQILTIIKI